MYLYLKKEFRSAINIIIVIRILVIKYSDFQNYLLHQKLFVGKQPSNDVSEGPYPTIITNKGRDVLVTQAFWAGKYLGFLNVTFNDEGDVSSWNGDPILLDNSTAQGTNLLLKR